MSNPAAKPACEICGSASQRMFEKRGIAILECAPCLHRFADYQQPKNHVADVYGDEYFAGGGAGYQDYLAQRELRTEVGRDYARAVRSRISRGNLLDVGAAAGFVMQGFVEEGWTASGLEPNPCIANFAQTELSMNVAVGTLEGLKPGDDRQFDLVSMIQVIAHFHDLHRALENARRVTRPGGYWLIESWDYRSLTARAFGRNWHEYSPPSVLRWFSRRSLVGACERFGMVPVARGRPNKSIRGQHAKSLLRHSLESSALLRWGIPLVGVLPDWIRIPYVFDDVFWMLFQTADQPSDTSNRGAGS